MSNISITHLPPAPWLNQRRIIISALFLLVITLLAQRWPAGPVQTPSLELAASSGQLPLAFVPNEGQSDPVVRFQARGMGGSLFFTPGGVTMRLPVAGEQDLPATITLRFEGANPAPAITGGERLPGLVNYIIGNNADQWQTHLPIYTGVVYRQLYDGIDLVYEGTDGTLKGTYLVAPGADPAQIRWRYEGAAGVRVDDAGSLVVTLPAGHKPTMIEQAPLAWQELNGQRVPVQVQYALAADGTIGFALPANYNTALPLTIDPTLAYGTYLGGLSSDFINDLSLDSAGNIYVAGWTYNNNLGGFPNPVHGYTDAFVAKLNPAGTAWQWITYIGGNDKEQGYGLAAGDKGVWLTGYTSSADFPTTANAYQSQFAGFYDVILARLNPTTGAVTYSTLFGFELRDEGRDVALDGDGNAYVTGVSGQAASEDALVIKMTGEANPTFVYGWAWGDEMRDDRGYSIVVDSEGKAYITGVAGDTPSGQSTFPIVNGMQPECGPYTYDTGDTSCTYDAFVSVWNAAGDDLVYSTLLGGSGSPETGSGADEGRGIALDPQGNIYITGFTYAADFPTVNAAYLNYPDPTNMADAWVTKLSSDGQTILYSTYLGADSDDEAQNIIADANGNAYVAGYTRSTDFPVKNPIQANLGLGGVCFSGSTHRHCYDTFLTKLTSSGSVAWSTYLGQGWDEYAYGLARDGSGIIYVAGVTNSPDYPTTAGAPQPTLGGNEDGFITKIADGTAPPPPPGSEKVFLPLVIR